MFIGLSAVKDVTLVTPGHTGMTVDQPFCAGFIAFVLPLSLALLVSALVHVTVLIIHFKQKRKGTALENISAG